MKTNLSGAKSIDRNALVSIERIPISLSSAPSLHLSDSFRFVQSANVVATPVDEELVLLDIRRGRYFSLNRVGGHVWNVLITGVSVEELQTSVCAHFAVAPQRAADDVAALVRDLQRHELVKYS